MVVGKRRMSGLMDGLIVVDKRRTDGWIASGGYW